jgi:uncharacterized protein YbcC (UPF0753/DUF2309 family)
MPIDRSVVRARIENAAEYVGPLWPLQTFNAANPLVGFEDQPFDRAVQQAEQLFGGQGYPSARVFRQAWEDGEIDPDVLTRRLAEHGISQRPEVLLDRMQTDEGDLEPSTPADHPLNRVMVKWLAAFLDQGQADWPMPNRADGLYAAWRTVAPYDTAVPGITQLSDVPATVVEAFEEVLAAYPEEQWESIFAHHLAALPGWVGFIKWRARRGNTPWQKAHPITLVDYLAVRLTLARRMGHAIAPDRADELPVNGTDRPFLPRIWLRAWEESYRSALLGDLQQGHLSTRNGARPRRPDAQLVFCIDTRSEVIRRQIEAQGNYETHGYAGFFGVPMQHQPYGAGPRVKACPPIVDPKHRIAERPAERHRDRAERYDGWRRLGKAGQKLLRSLKKNVAAAFGFVEGSGGFFAGAMAARTLFPSGLFSLGRAVEARLPGPDFFCEPTVDREPEDFHEHDGLPVGLSQDAKVLYAEAAFELMGWTTFAPLVVFAGHASQTPNNPYKSSLDCGACAGNPGGPNARVLAAICNDEAVQEALRERGLDLPEDTVFLAGQHNTTTDEIRLFVDDDPPVASEALDRLRQDLRAAQSAATAERMETMNATVDAGRSAASIQEAQRRAADWAETRPEWGLAGNAGFIVGPRALTRNLDLDGRCFLHSYDWTTDDDGTALETIMTGPLVVGEWINTQYYFSTVDNAAYGSGSKVTQNVVGKVGVVQGNGGDLMSGLPLQSLQADDETVMHRPLRLLAVIHAPVARVEAIIERHATLAQLLDHEWMTLVVMDPEQDGAFVRYRPGGEWEPHSTDVSSAEAEPPVPAGAAS